jgi:hypothetical protein
MGQSIHSRHSRRSGEDSQLWLSMLIRAMERTSRPEVRSQPCDRAILAALHAQLSRPAWPRMYRTSAFSLRN